MRIGSVVALMAIGAVPLAGQNAPGVDVWIANPSGKVRQGTVVAAHAVADPGAYLVVFRVTPDNRIVIITPHTPYQVSRVPSSGLHADGLNAPFRVAGANGVGYVFVAAAYTPFNFSRVSAGGHWNGALLATPPRGDAIDMADWFIQQIVPSHDTPYGVTDVAYYVGVAPPSTALNEEQAQAPPEDVPQVEPPSDVVYTTPPYYDPYPYYGVYPYPWGVYPYVTVYGGVYFRGPGYRRGPGHVGGFYRGGGGMRGHPAAPHGGRR
jgi:hypothetical protein